ncbi:MAG: 16S rRNA (guanine(966)-N(2))-methyltransferase RsmD [Proteobacteria bacterium]|nr:16S rRNA (guanine(966)-N(2))-methyltransferase RsmD [Pseudomonadota bacterium]
MNQRRERPAPRVVRRAGEQRTLRIIAGAWRGRKWRFPEGAIRPTPDRVRETLFNWLGPRLAGARCLDLFAGSGALGLEALSRGAAHATFVDQDAGAARELSARLSEWRAPDARVLRTDALGFLAQPPASSFDIVFLDPPFDSGLLPQAAAALAQGRWLADGFRVYLECPARVGLPPVPPAWRLLKSGRAGEVGYHLFA